MALYPEYGLDTIADVLDSEDVYEHIIARDKILLQAEGEPFDLYTRKTSGDTCPAPHVSNKRRQATEHCELCIGTRFLGGYDLYRYTTEVIEPTNSNSSVPVVLTGLTLEVGRERNSGVLRDPLTGGTAESDWIDTSDAVAYVLLQTLSAVDSSTDGSVVTEYKFFDKDWKAASLLTAEDVNLITDKRIKLRVTVTWRSGDDSPQWFNTWFRWQSSSIVLPRMINESERGRLRIDRHGLVYEDVPPMWTSPTPVIGQRDFVSFPRSSDTRRFLITDLQITGLGIGDKAVRQSFGTSKLEPGHPYGLVP